MKIISTMLWLGIMTANLTGCGAIIASAAIKDMSSTRAKLDFTMQLNRQNEERRKAGSTPLDWCVEAYKIDKSWLVGQPDCQRKGLDIPTPAPLVMKGGAQ